MIGGGKPGGRFGGRQKGGSSDDNAWLETYADAITLLMAFFVVLLSLSKTDVAKYERVAQAIRAEISHEPVPVMEQPDIPEVANPSVGDKEGGSEGVEDRLATRIEPIAKHDNVTVQTTSEAILIEFSGTMLYDTGSAVLRKKALPVIDEVTDSLLEITDADYDVVIEGHTDDVPIGLSVFPSNWELSSARATSIVRRMLEKGVGQGSVSASAFADTRPLVPNIDDQGKGLPENRARNRRVVIRINRSAKTP